MENLFATMEGEEATPSLSQAQRMKSLSQSGHKSVLLKSLKESLQRVLLMKTNVGVTIAILNANNHTQRV